MLSGTFRRWSASARAEEWLQRVLACRDAGADGFGCYNYGLVRPEHLRVAPRDDRSAEDRPDEDGGGGWTRLDGRINQGTYLGEQTEYRVQTDQAGELIVRRQNQLGEATGQGLGPGEPVEVRWHEEANLILVG